MTAMDEDLETAFGDQLSDFVDRWVPVGGDEAYKELFGLIEAVDARSRPKPAPKYRKVDEGVQEFGTRQPISIIQED